MRFTRKGMVLGVATLGVAGALAGGVGVAQAATGTPTPSTTASAAPYGHGFGTRGPAFDNSPLNAAASYLGLSVTDLRAKLRSGDTLAQVAAARGKSVSGLEDAMVAEAKANIEANTRLTAAQRSTLLAQVSDRIDAMIDQGCPVGAGPAGGGMGVGTGGWMGGRMGGTTNQ